MPQTNSASALGGTHHVLTIHGLMSFFSIDLQKINWKFRTGFSTHTGVSLKEHVPNNPRGGYPRGHQDTAESRDRQRPPPPSSACLLARRCAVGAAHHRVD